MALAFGYRPISNAEIRLIWITNNRDNDILKCRLQHFWLDTKPQYIALSYVWGDATDTVPIFLEGCDFGVTRNLHEALLQIRRWTNHPYADTSSLFRTQGPWLIWADAVCIDQGNMDERLREIPRMKDIFSSAVTVLGWLGPTPLGMQEKTVATVFDKAMQIVQDTPRDNIFDKMLGPEHPVKSLVTVDYEGFTKAFFDIISLPWFSRIWIIQECAVASQDVLLALGQIIIPFQCLTYLYSLYAYRHEWLTQKDLGAICIAQISDIRSWYQDPERYYRIFKLDAAPDDSNEGCGMNFAIRLNAVLKEAALAPFSSTVPHDMIYGILSMASQGLQTIPKELQPDYSVPFSEVCRLYAKFIAEQTGDLSFLWRFRRPDAGSGFSQSRAHIPSWVPDFSQNAPLMRSMTPIKSKPSFSDDGKVMFVQGVQLGTVCSSVNPDWRSLEELDVHAHWQQQALLVYTQLQMAAGIRKVAVDDILQDWLKTFEGRFDRVYERDESEVRVLSNFFKSWVDATEEVTDGDPMRNITTKPSARVQAILDLIKRDLISTSSFLTEDPSVWYSIFKNEDIHESDVLCMLSGAPSPAILRPVGEEGFRFLSVAQIHAGRGFKHVVEDDSIWESSRMFSLV